MWERKKEAGKKAEVYRGSNRNQKVGSLGEKMRYKNWGNYIVRWFPGLVQSTLTSTKVRHVQWNNGFTHNELATGTQDVFGPGCLGRNNSWIIEVVEESSTRGAYKEPHKWSASLYCFLDIFFSRAFYNRNSLVSRFPPITVLFLCLLSFHLFIA